MKKGIGDKFQEETRYDPQNMPRVILDWENKPETYKEYLYTNKVELPPQEEIETKNFHEVLLNRKTVRNFSHKPISIEQLSYLLWASTGIQRNERGFEFRTAPSAGALYPIETYLVVNNVANVAQGIYHYNIKNHHLEELMPGDYREKISTAALKQNLCQHASVVFVWSAVFERSKWKYQQRAYRYIYLDAGHIAQNLALAVNALGLGSCQIAALFDELSNEIFELDGEKESVIYMTAAGCPAVE
jgi:SagB-type dehydrogenase family enzyme